ncbi:hypothetical protein ACFXG4_22830 [Nocardia sp. NPDC059246]|uniref:hypothetical protein n=1 Tax=unclassified Nocardia TaxID=2637762 RepID=UPI0036A654ED
MLVIDHFTYGWLTPVLAYVMSVTGSLLALRCMVRARNQNTGRGRIPHRNLRRSPSPVVS